MKLCAFKACDRDNDYPDGNTKWRLGRKCAKRSVPFFFFFVLLASGEMVQKGVIAKPGSWLILSDAVSDFFLSREFNRGSGDFNRRAD